MAGSLENRGKLRELIDKLKINELYELNRKTQLQIELLKEQLNNYNEKDIRKSNGGKYNTWTDEMCDNK